MFREAAKPAALNQAGDADGGAAAALNIGAGLGGDGVVSLQPNCSRADSDGPLRNVSGLATTRNEILLDGNVMHMMCPNQERIGRVRCALIAVATSFDDEPQIVVAGKIYGGCDVVGISCSNSVDTRFGGPTADPAQGLGDAGGIADVEGVFQICEESFALRALGRGHACVHRKIDLNQVASDRLL